MDLVGLMMDLSGKRFLPRGSLALLDFHTIRAVCEVTISFRVQRPSFIKTDFEGTLSLRLTIIELNFKPAMKVERKLQKWYEPFL